MRESGFWGRLDDGERDVLMKQGWVREFPDGAMLCMEGEPTTHLFILLSGWVKVITSDPDGREVLAAVRGEGDIAGEIAQVVGYRTATLRALGKVRTLVVGAEKFGGFLDVHAQAARVYRRIMAEYQHAAHDSQRGLSILSGPRRLAHLLLVLAERHGTQTAEGVVTTLPLSQEDLASLIGSSRSTVTRALRQWRARSIIATRQRHIVILDVADLRRIAGELPLPGVRRLVADACDERGPLCRRKREHRTRAVTSVPDQHCRRRAGDFDAVAVAAAPAALAPR